LSFVECEGEMRRVNCLFVGKSILQFIEVYGNMLKVDKLITRNKDPGGSIGLCKDFISLIVSTMKQSQKISLSTNENTKNIVRYIEHYLMTKLYTWYEIGL